mmetsp:Transcript_14754/g.16375  ORF Transcript_14754/g.16375 Transcript_14754/m.16375 type:complete len:233 (-) Transcript_14754:35-733(-)
MATKAYSISVQGQESGINIYQTKPNSIQYAKNSKGVSKTGVDEVKGAFVLRNVLTPDECAQYVKITEEMSYDLAYVTGYSGMQARTDIRNNKRVIWQSDDSIWAPIYERIADLVPKTVKLNGVDWKACGLNERLRFYRYEEGEEFVKHYDGCYPRNKKERSFLTFIIYLTDDFEDGWTTFYPQRNKPIRVKPEKGMALLFYHSHPLSPLHEGSLCHNGKKYVLRSDVMYRYP